MEQSKAGRGNNACWRKKSIYHIPFCLLFFKRRDSFSSSLEQQAVSKKNKSFQSSQNKCDKLVKTTQTSVRLSLNCFLYRCYQCCRNEHEQMNISKQDKPNINQLRPHFSFANVGLPIKLFEYAFFCFLFFSFNIICKKSKKKQRRRNIKVRKSAN